MSPAASGHHRTNPGGICWTVSIYWSTRLRRKQNFRATSNILSTWKQTVKTSKSWDWANRRATCRTLYRKHLIESRFGPDTAANCFQFWRTDLSVTWSAYNSFVLAKRTKRLLVPRASLESFIFSANDLLCISCTSMIVSWWRSKGLPKGDPHWERGQGLWFRVYGPAGLTLWGPDSAFFHGCPRTRVKDWLMNDASLWSMIILFCFLGFFGGVRKIWQLWSVWNFCTPRHNLPTLKWMSLHGGYTCGESQAVPWERCASIVLLCQNKMHRQLSWFAPQHLVMSWNIWNSEPAHQVLNFSWACF